MQMHPGSCVEGQKPLQQVDAAAAASSLAAQPSTSYINVSCVVELGNIAAKGSSDKPSRGSAAGSSTSTATAVSQQPAAPAPATAADQAATAEAEAADPAESEPAAAADTCCSTLRMYQTPSYHPRASLDVQECRICLSAGDSSDLIQPCSCTGSLSNTHAACLQSWVKERGSLACELCGQQYKEPHAKVLAPLAEAAALKRKQRAAAQEALVVEIASDIGEVYRGIFQLSPGQWLCALLLVMLFATIAVAAGLLINKRQTYSPTYPAGAAEMQGTTNVSCNVSISYMRSGVYTCA